MHKQQALAKFALYYEDMKPKWHYRPFKRPLGLRERFLRSVPKPVRMITVQTGTVLLGLFLRFR